MPSLERWRALWARLGVQRCDEALYEQLVARYNEPHRQYHTIQHLDECFARLAELEAEAKHAEHVELALWFHDAIYDTKRSDNEAQSAQWCKTAVMAADLDESLGDAVHTLVMATRHDAVANGADEQVLVDIDLSILGAPMQRFDEYERQVREEYAWVPGLVFRSKRRAILRSFLDRPRLFSTDKFFAAYETQARVNLQRSLARLGG